MYFYSFLAKQRGLFLQALTCRFSLVASQAEIRPHDAMAGNLRGMGITFESLSDSARRSDSQVLGEQAVGSDTATGNFLQGFIDT